MARDPLDAPAWPGLRPAPVPRGARPFLVTPGAPPPRAAAADDPAGETLLPDDDPGLEQIMARNPPHEARPGRRSLVAGRAGGR